MVLINLQENIENGTKTSVELQESFDKKYGELVQIKKQMEESFNVCFFFYVCNREHHLTLSQVQFTEAQEKVQTMERELGAKVSAEAQEKCAALARVAEVEAELVDFEQRLTRKSELVQSLQDELAVFAECLKQKEKEVESLGVCFIIALLVVMYLPLWQDKLQSLVQANAQKEAELSVQGNEISMKISQFNSELEVQNKLIIICIAEINAFADCSWPSHSIADRECTPQESCFRSHLSNNGS